MVPVISRMMLLLVVLFVLVVSISLGVPIEKSGDDNDSADSSQQQLQRRMMLMAFSNNNNNEWAPVPIGPRFVRYQYPAGPRLAKRNNAEVVNHILKNFGQLDRLGDIGRR